MPSALLLPCSLRAAVVGGLHLSLSLPCPAASCPAAPQTPAEVSWLASWAGSLAALGLALPAASRARLLGVMRQRRRQLRPVDRSQLAHAFGAWGDQEGLSFVEQLDAAACTVPPR